MWGQWIPANNGRRALSLWVCSPARLNCHKQAYIIRLLCLFLSYRTPSFRFWLYISSRIVRILRYHLITSRIIMLYEPLDNSIIHVILQSFYILLTIDQHIRRGVFRIYYAFFHSSSRSYFSNRSSRALLKASALLEKILFVLIRVSSFLSQSFERVSLTVISSYSFSCSSFSVNSLRQLRIWIMYIKVTIFPSKIYFLEW